MDCVRVAWRVIPTATGGSNRELQEAFRKQLLHEDLTSMGTLAFTELLSTVTVLGTMLFFNSMIIFLSGKHRQHKLLDLNSLTVFALLWIGTLIFEPGIETKVYVTSLAVSLVVVRMLVTRHRKRSLPGG